MIPDNHPPPAQDDSAGDAANLRPPWRRKAFDLLAALSLLLAALWLNLWVFTFDRGRCVDFATDTFDVGVYLKGGKIFVATLATTSPPPRWWDAGWHYNRRDSETHGPAAYLWWGNGNGLSHTFHIGGAEFWTYQERFVHPEFTLTWRRWGGCWFSYVFALLCVMPVAWGAFATIAAPRKLRERRRMVNHLCGQCGYDLRASRERCPECGTAIESPPRQARVRLIRLVQHSLQLASATLLCVSVYQLFEMPHYGNQFAFRCTLIGAAAGALADLLPVPKRPFISRVPNLLIALANALVALGLARFG